MQNWQKLIISLYGIFSFIGFIKGWKESKTNHNVYGLSRIFNLIGAFVWGDALIFGAFWTLVSIFTLVLDDWTLFLLFLAIFWLIRGLGEMVYWLNQQFAPVKRDPPEKFWHYKIFKNDSVYFINQIVAQCVAVIAAIAAIVIAISRFKKQKQTKK